MEYLQNLEKANADRVQLRDAGFSYENRTLKTITVTNGDGRTDKNVIFVDATFHGREWLPPHAAVYLVEQLVSNFKENMDLLKDYDWIILPLVNPDGYVHSYTFNNMWRFNRKPSRNGYIGTDLNRNFGFQWGRLDGSSRNPRSELFAGNAPFSEPESRIVRDIMHDLVVSGRGIMYITLHSYMNAILYSYDYTNRVFPKNMLNLSQVAHAGANAVIAKGGDLKAIYESYEASGTSQDYAYCVGFPLVFTFELPGNDFWPKKTKIDGFVKESWTAIRAMAKKAMELYPLGTKIPKFKGKFYLNMNDKCINY
ncbi:carboxypeptidase B-like [Scaptodrosophila lebanonensis]|uniref:Carboxypeptidase B-like n=1 Tax=Drosophila lebanonensis TaxID=7225 RepID=A0A6J2TUI6_DROLE|nr:carboxypeptidase B-like [Scaptodrosophila lebanonensis]